MLGRRWSHSIGTGGMAVSGEFLPTRPRSTSEYQSGYHPDSHGLPDAEEREQLLRNDGARSVEDAEIKASRRQGVVIPPKPTRLGCRGVVTIVIMCCVNFFWATNFSIPAPIFPPAAMKKGMSQSLIGFVIGVFNLCMFIASPIVGLIISRVGAKFLFVSGALFSAVSGILFGLLEFGPGGTTYAVMCFLTRSFQAVGSATFSTASYAIIAQMFPDRIATFFSLMETFLGIGMMTGPVIGGTLFQVGGYYVPFLAMGLMLVVSALVVAFIVPPITDPYVPKSHSILHYISRPPTILLIYTILCMAICITFLEPTFTTFLHDTFQMEAYQVGFMFLIMPGLYAVIGPIIGYIGDRKGYLMTMILAGALFVGVGFAFNSPPPFLHIRPQLWIVIVANIVVGLFIGCCFVPVFPALLITALDVGYADNFDTNGMVSGVMVAAFSFGGFIGATAAGFLVQHLGFSWSLFVVTCLFLLDVVLLTIYALVKRRLGGDIFDRRRTMANLAAKHNNI